MDSIIKKMIPSLILIFIFGFVAQSIASQIKKGGILRIGYNQDLEGLDPARHGGGAGNITCMLFERLLELKPDGSVGPALASSWKWLSDTEMQFNLRKGVKFHSGNPFNAEVAKWSIDWLTNKEKGAIQFSYLGPLISGVDVKDEYTIVVKLKQPYSAFEKAAGNHLIMRDKVMYEELGDLFGTEGVSGTGPWRFKEWKPRSYVLLERNPDWWGEGNYLDGLRFDILTEQTTRVLAFKKGDVDVLVGPSPENFKEFEGNSKFKLYAVPGDRLFKYDFDYDDPKWQNRNMRKAISLAIDSVGITEAFAGPFGSPGKSIMTSIHESYVPNDGYLEYDPQKARRLLEAEGYQPGSGGILQKNGNPLVVSFGTSDVGFRKDIAEAMAAQLSAIGIKGVAKATERGAYWGELLKDDIPFDLFDTNWGSLMDEVGMLYGHYWGPTSSPEGLTMSRRSGDPIDSLIVKAVVTIDYAERMKTLKELQEVFYNDTVALVLYDSRTGWATLANVEGFAPHPGSYYPYLYVGVWLDR